MNEAGWKRWREAEAKLARGDGAEAAAQGLSERQAWILRASEAIECGARDRFDALHETAPAELVALIDVSLSDPGYFDPSGMRAKLKWLRVSNVPMPTLDLLRLMCVAHNGAQPTRPQPLAKAAHTRPVLEGALMVLSKRFKAYVVHDELAQRSPRMATFWAAGIAQQLAPGNARAFMQAQAMDFEELTLDAWPDLDARLEAKRHGDFASLSEFLLDPLGLPWSPICTRHVRMLSEIGDAQERRDTLGGLLDAIHVLIESAAPARVLPVVEGALDLADAVPHVEHKRDLVSQLLMLELRLQWAAGVAGDEIFGVLWSGLDGLSEIERAHAARALLERWGDEPLPCELATEVVAAAARGEWDWEEIVFPWIAQNAQVIDLGRFTSALRGLASPRRERTLGALHTLCESQTEALRLCAQLYAQGSVKEADGLAPLAFRRSAKQRTGRQARRLHQRALLELAHAAAACDPPPSARVLSGLLGASERDFAPDGRELIKTIAPCALRRVSLPPEAGHTDLLARLQLLSLLGRDEEAAAAFREFGRWLRRSPGDVSIPTALRLCASLCASEALLSDFQSGAAPAGPHASWLRSMTHWLEHQPAQLVARKALSLARGMRADPSALARWYAEIANVEGADEWQEVVELAQGNDEPFKC